MDINTGGAEYPGLFSKPAVCGGGTEIDIVSCPCTRVCDKLLVEFPLFSGGMCCIHVFFPCRNRSCPICAALSLLIRCTGVVMPHQTVVSPYFSRSASRRWCRAASFSLLLMSSTVWLPACSAGERRETFTPTSRPGWVGGSRQSR